MMQAGRLLLVGASSRIGRNVARVAEARGMAVVGTSRSGGVGTKWLAYDLLRDPPERLLRCEPTNAVVLAAESSIADCEREPQRTRQVNVQGVTALVEALASEGVRVALASSSSVFSGANPRPSLSARPDPVSEYGRQKQAMEQACLDLHGVTICRLTKVLAGPTIIQTWAASLGRGDSIEAFTNLVIAPLTGEAAAHGLLEASLAAERPRIVHISAPDEVSYAQVADLVGESVGADPKLVRHVQAPFDPPLGLLPAPFAALGSPRWDEAFPLQPSAAVIRSYLLGTTQSPSK